VVILGQKMGARPALKTYLSHSIFTPAANRISKSLLPATVVFDKSANISGPSNVGFPLLRDHLDIAAFRYGNCPSG